MDPGDVAEALPEDVPVAIAETLLCVNPSDERIEAIAAVCDDAEDELLDPFSTDADSEPPDTAPPPVRW